MKRRTQLHPITHQPAAFGLVLRDPEPPRPTTRRVCAVASCATPSPLRYAGLGAAGAGRYVCPAGHLTGGRRELV